MKRLTVLVVVILFAFCGSAFAAARCECASYTVNLQAFASPFDQHQELQRLSLELGAQNVAAVVATAPELPRYLVFVRACDAYVCFVPKGRSIAQASVYEWSVFDRSEEAFGEYARHEEAAARGVITMGDGSIVVYWSSTGATAAR